MSGVTQQAVGVMHAPRQHPQHHSLYYSVSKDLIKVFSENLLIPSSYKRVKGIQPNPTSTSGTSGVPATYGTSDASVQVSTPVRHSSSLQVVASGVSAPVQGTERIESVGG